VGVGVELIKAKSLWLATGIAGLELVAVALLIFAREDSTPHSAAAETRIFISDDMLNETYGLPTDRHSNAASLGSMTAYADGKKCVTVSMTDRTSRGSRPPAVTIPEDYRRRAVFASTGKIMVVGAKGQPDECREPGARLTLKAGTAGGQLWQEFTVQPGTTYELTSLGMPPPGTGEDDEPAPLGSDDGPAFAAPETSGPTDWLLWGVVGAGIGALAGLFLAYAYMRRKSPRART